MDGPWSTWQPRRRSGLLEHELDGELLVYAADRHQAFALNQAAAAIWELCDGSATAVQMAATLGQRYACEPRAFLPDVLTTLRELSGLRLLDAPS